MVRNVAPLCLASSTKSFQVSRFVVEIPRHCLDLLPDISVEPAHAMAFDEGNHVILDCGEIFLHEKHVVPRPLRPKEMGLLPP